METRKLFCMGLVMQILLDKKRFKLNESLHPFVKIFEDFFQVTDREGNPGFRPYLFDSRPLLASRINKMILEENDSVKMKDLFQRLDKYIRVLVDNESGSGSKTTNQDSLLNDVREGLNKSDD